MTAGRNLYELKQFTRGTFAATRTAWLQEVAEHRDELLSLDYERFLGWADMHIDYDAAGQGSFCYGVFAEASSEAIAIVDVAYAANAQRWLKLLDIHLSPAVDLSFSSGNIDTQRINAIFVAAVVGTIALTSKAHPSRTTKLYGRSVTLRAFLNGFGAYFQEKGGIEGLEVAVEGRWLVFRA